MGSPVADTAGSGEGRSAASGAGLSHLFRQGVVKQQCRPRRLTIASPRSCFNLRAALCRGPSFSGVSPHNNARRRRTSRQPFGTLPYRARERRANMALSTAYPHRRTFCWHRFETPNRRLAFGDRVFRFREDHRQRACRCRAARRLIASVNGCQIKPGRKAGLFLV